MVNTERFTPLLHVQYIHVYIYAILITHTIMSSMENLHFGKEDYFHVLVFYTSYFIKEIENIFPVLPYIIEILVEV